MGYNTFHCSRIGATHLRLGLPCQDSSAHEDYGGWHIAVVADGHGSRRHFRSESGSRIACEVTMKALRELIDNDNRPLLLMDEQLFWVKRRICALWREEVLRDAAAFPWTEEELKEQEDLLKPEQLERLISGEDAPFAYGTTLCLAWICDEGWAAAQLGDGCMVHISPDGDYDWPMPPSSINSGNKTASLCMADPMRDFRHCWGTDSPAGMLLCTDGIEKTFPAQSAGIIDFMHWVLNNERTAGENRQENLEKTLDMFTRRSAIGDDVTVAGIVNPSTPDAPPRPGRTQRMQELERLRARILEIENIIAFNDNRLRQLGERDAKGELATRLREIVEAKRVDARALRTEEATRAAALGLTAMSNAAEAAPPEPDGDWEEAPLWDFEEATGAAPGETVIIQTTDDKGEEDVLLEVRSEADGRRERLRLLRRRPITARTQKQRRKSIENALRSLRKGRGADQ